MSTCNFFVAEFVAALALLFAAITSGQTPDFYFSDGTIGDLRTVSIENSATGDKAVIVIDFGGRVEELRLASQGDEFGRVRDVLLGHHGDSSAIKENKWWKGMLLLPYANRIAYGRYTFYNYTYHLPMNDDPRFNALHGFMANKSLTVVSKTADMHSANLTTRAYIRNEQGYPFSLDLIIEYMIDVNHVFSITVTATNVEGFGNPLPFYIGWHPYFKCTPHSTVITFDPCHEWTHVDMNLNLDPTGHVTRQNPFDGSKPIGGPPGNPTFYDDEYKSLLSGSLCGSRLETKIEDKASLQTVVLWQDFDNHFVHVFTGYQDEPSVAVEPMSAMADAFNNHDGLSILSDGQSWKGSFGVYVKNI